MKILFVGHSPHMAGAEYSLLRLVRRLRDRVEARILAPGGGGFEREIRGLGLPFHAFSPRYPLFSLQKRGGEVLEAMASLALNATRLRSEIPMPDLVHSNTFFIWEGALLAGLWQRPHVWNLREFLDRSPTWTPILGYQAQLRLMDLLTDRFVCVSRALAESLSGVPPEKIASVNNGLDPEGLASREEARAFFRERFGIPDSNQVLLTVGNFIPEKGHDFLARTVPAVVAANPEVRFLWVGRHDFHHSESLRLLRASGTERVVIAPGQVDGFGRFMRGADLYILPSSVEACPTVALEALLAGIPVISRDSGGIRELLSQGGGLLLQEDSPEAMARTILGFLDRSLEIPGLRQFPFTMENMAGAYLESYKLAAADYRPGPGRAAAIEALLVTGTDLLPAFRDLEDSRRKELRRSSSITFRVLRRLGLAGRNQADSSARKASSGS